MKDEIQLKDYKALIYKQANICYNKIKKFSGYLIEDLVQEGVMVFYKILDKYNKEKASFCTFLTTVLKNHYSKIVLYEYKNKFTTSPYITRMVDSSRYWEDEKDFIEESFNKPLTLLACKVAKIIGTSDCSKMGLKSQIKEELGISTRHLNQIYTELEYKLRGGV